MRAGALAAALLFKPAPSIAPVKLAIPAAGAAAAPAQLAPSLLAPTALPVPTPAPLSPALAVPIASPAAFAPAAAQQDGQPIDLRGRKLFDGSRPLVSSEFGAVFAVEPAGRGATRLRLLRPSAPAALRPVEGTDGLTGAALLERVSDEAVRGQEMKTYLEASDYLFTTAESIEVNGVRGVVDAYSGVFVPGASSEGRDYPEPGDKNGDGYHDKAMNVEHLWPQSLFNRKLPMRSDLHHLMATFEYPNRIRGSMPFGWARGKLDYSNAGGAKRDDRFFEPPDAVKGRVARAALYFRVAYKDKGLFGPKSARFFDAQLETLLEWNRRFPPDAFEAQRNDLIEDFQGNRNPFVDDPGLADRIGADALRLGRKIRPVSSFNKRPVETRKRRDSNWYSRRHEKRHAPARRHRRPRRSRSRR